MHLIDFLARERVRADVRVAAKSALLQDIAAALAPEEAARVRDGIVHALERRESLGSTGLGNGVALPHARVPAPFDATAAFFRLDPAVDFGAPDGIPVDLVLALVVPEHETNQHLNLLAQTADLLSVPQVVNELRGAKDSAQLYECLRRHSLPARAA